MSASTSNSRRKFLGQALAGGVVLGTHLVAGATKAAHAEEMKAMTTDSNGKMNVLLILTDDQGADLACLGTQGMQTPNIDALYERGVGFEQAYSTSASCSPARSGLLTGMYPHANGHWRNTHSPTVPGNDVDYSRESKYKEIEPVGVHEDIPTIVEILNAAGYATAINEKFHLSPVWKYPFTHRFGASPKPQTHGKAMRDFMQAKGDRPFFMMANIGNTHRPFPPHIVDEVPKVDPGAIEIPANYCDTPEMRADFEDYYNTVQGADACVGELLKALEASGEAEHTLVIFTSDQGFCFHRAKATSYHKGTYVPFCISGPGIKRGERTETLVSHVDVMPTILDFLGISIPETVQGQSLLPWCGGKDAAPEGREFVGAEHNAHGPNPLEYYPSRAITDGRFYYIRNLMHERCWEGDPADLIDNPTEEVHFAGPADAFPTPGWHNHSFAATVHAREEFPVQYDLLKATLKRPAEELYDLHLDPDETRNLADDPRYETHLARMREALDSWQTETDDPGVKTRDIPRRQ